MLDKSAFGYYNIAKLFITGNVLKTAKYNEIYHWFITSEMAKETKSQIREKTYRTTFEISLQTSRSMANNNQSAEVGKPSFCYDIFLKGELRTVFSKTYCISKEPKTENYFIQIDNTPKFGHSNAIIVRGDEMYERKYQGNTFQMGSCYDYKIEGCSCKCPFDRHIRKLIHIFSPSNDK